MIFKFKKLYIFPTYPRIKAYKSYIYQKEVGHQEINKLIFHLFVYNTINTEYANCLKIEMYLV